MPLWCSSPIQNLESALTRLAWLVSRTCVESPDRDRGAFTKWVNFSISSRTFASFRFLDATRTNAHHGSCRKFIRSVFSKSKKRMDFFSTQYLSVFDCQSIYRHDLSLLYVYFRVYEYIGMRHLLACVKCRLACTIAARSSLRGIATQASPKKLHVRNRNDYFRSFFLFFLQHFWNVLLSD